MNPATPSTSATYTPSRTLVTPESSFRATPSLLAFSNLTFSMNSSFSR